MPRLPKLPPMRASAAPTATSEKTITRAANKLPSFTNRDVVIEQLRQYLTPMWYEKLADVRDEMRHGALESPCRVPIDRKKSRSAGRDETVLANGNETGRHASV